jgi:TRAP-type C4-dicarboxylate transport system substrate-binding protein
MKKARWVVVLLALALVVGLVALVAVSCGGTEETTTTAAPTTTVPDTGQNEEFIFSHAMAVPASLTGTWLVPWQQALLEAGNGRITVKEYPDSALYEEALQYPNMIAGQADLTLISTEFIPGTLPVFELANLPMVFPNPEVATRVMWDLIKEYGQNELKDVKVLGLVCLTPSEYAGLTPVHTPADMVGKKFRAAGGPEIDTLTALGAIPLETEVPAWAKYDSKLDKLVLDPTVHVDFEGVFLSWAYINVRGANLWATNFTQADLQYRMFILGMNKKKWDTLPVAIQQAFIDTTGVENSVKYNNDNVRVNETGDNYAATVARAEELGTPIYVLTAEDKALWKAAVKPVIDSWVTDHASTLPAQDIMDRLNELVEQYSAGSTATTAPAGAAATTSSAE